MRKYIKNSYWLLLCSIICAFTSCNKEDTQFSAPYEDGVLPLGVELNPTNKMEPEEGLPGVETTLKIIGLDKYKNNVIFKFNGEVAEIVNITNQSITVKVPPFASSGVVSITIDDIVFFGPRFTVEGNVSLDPTFQAGTGANGTVSNVLFMPDGKMIFTGGFNNYNRKGTVRPINRIVRTYADGTYDAGFRTGKAANGFLSGMVKIGNNFFIAGSFSGYDQRTDNISNLTSLLLTGSIDTVGVHPFRRPDQTDTIKYYPRFNGGFNSGVNQIYESEGKIIAAGNFRYYISRRYDKPNALETRDSIILDSTEIRHVARLNLDGSLDKTFRFKPDGTPFSGGNGNINTLQHTSGDLKGKILVFGNFNRFDDQAKGYIVRLNADGTIDPTFNAGSSGADYNIFNATYNPVTHKYVLVGDFNNYNGKPAHKVAVINDDGSLDQSFVIGQFEGGNPNHGQQLDDGLIVISGYFAKYNKVSRSGFMILNRDGSLNQLYNSTGRFSGSVYQMVETRTEDGKRALLIMGSIGLFDNQPVGNVFRIKLEP